MTNEEREEIIKQAAVDFISAEEDLSKEIKKVSEKYSKRLNSLKDVHYKAFNALKDRVEKIVSEYKKEGNTRLFPDSYDDANTFSGEWFLKQIIYDGFPRDLFDEYLYIWETDYFYERGGNKVIEYVKNALTTEECVLYDKSEEEMKKLIENLPEAWSHYNAEDYNCDVKVNLLVDSGNWNYDCSCDNVCNYCGNGEIPEESSILYLAKKQGKEEILRKAMDYYKLGNADEVEKICDNDRFVFSCIQEWENLTCSCGTLCFLVKMPLFDLFEILEAQRDEILAERYCITLKKDVICGLFDPLNGGGSVFEVELDSDITIPVKDIKVAPEDCNAYNFSLQSIYAMSGCAWTDSLVELTDPEMKKVM